MYNNNDDATTERIKKQEKKYRYITTLLLNDMFSGTTNTIQHTIHTEKVDVRFTAVTDNGSMITYDIEVKERNKNIEQYPNAELRCKKYEGMKEVSYNDNLIYIVFLNQKEAYIYNLTKMDWSTVRKDNWKIKKTQYKDNSTYVDELTYFIPVKLACKKINVEKYYKLYNANN